MLLETTPATTRFSGSRHAPKHTGWLLVLCLATGLVTHAWNVFRYPLYLTDEGIYTEQAWSVLHEGKLSPYTYFYDHAPMGWLTIAGWVGILPGGFQAFGNAINTGRVLMVIVHLASVFLLFEVVRRYSGSLAGAFVAAFLFNVSPLAVYYQRQVLLDNLMVFWVLVGLYILARKDGRVVTAMGAGTAFGLAMITKENAIFLLPGCAYLMHRGITGQSNRRFSASFWWFTLAAPVVAYMMYAQIKNELFPEGLSFDLSSPPTDHVSLLYTIWWQLHRSNTGDHGYSFSDLLHGSWLFKDKYLLIGGAVASVGVLLVSFVDKRWRHPLLGFALLAAGYGFYLSRSVLLDFYIAPIIVLFALNIGLLFAWITRYARPGGVALLTACSIAPLLVLPGGYLLQHDEFGRPQIRDAYRLPLTQLQTEQVNWIKANVPPDSRLIIDDDIWVALHDADPPYRYAHSHWKATADPDIRDKIFHSDWQNIDYVVMSNKMRLAMELNNGNGAESWVLNAIDQHGEKVWQRKRGDVELEIIKINNTG
jgi:4-amino-4-deoxy-L-arabinose transferase-like glycosyltransferase